MQFNEEKEYDCNGKKNQNHATVRRLINTGTLGVRLILSLRCAVNRQRIYHNTVCTNGLSNGSSVGD